MKWNYSDWLFLVVVMGALAFSTCSSQITMNIELLDGQRLPNAPLIPDITGPFSIDVVARFDNLSNGVYQTLFVFHNPANYIYLIQHGINDIMFFYMDDAGLPYPLQASGALTVGTLDRWRVGVSLNGTMTIHKNVFLLASLSNVPVPSGSVARPERLVGDHNWPSGTPLVGAVLGFELRNLNEAPPGFRTNKNLPGQIFKSHFVASIFGRFDDLSRSSQRLFDVGNGMEDNNIVLSQQGVSSRIYLEAWQDGQSTTCVSADNVIVEGEMALWKVEMEGTIWRIEKNGSSVKECSGKVIPKSIFRQSLKFGESNWPSDDDLHGVVLGFRLDLKAPTQPSPTAPYVNVVVP